MKKQAYVTRTGLKQWKPVVTEAQLQQADDEMIGFCLACGAERACCEPDARKYPCDECHQPKCYGLPELLVMGLVVLKAPRQRSRYSDGSLRTE
jgi:hypothetical protein